MNTSQTSKITKEQLLQENYYLRNIFTAMEEGLIITDSSGVIQKINPAVTKIWGYTEAELIGKHTMVLSAEKHTIGKKPASIERLHIDGSIKDVPGRYKKKDGSVFYAETNLQLLKDDEGEIIGAIGVFRDITKSRQLHEAVFDAETKFRIIADFTHDWETWIDVQGNLKYISPACKRITGYPAEEFFSRPDLLKELILPEDIEAVKKAHIKTLETRKTLEIQYRIRRRDGKIRWIELHSQPILLDNGAYLGQRGSNRDITERKEAEHALRQSEENYRALTETAPDAIITANGQGRIVSWNHGAEKIYGFKKKEIIGRDCVLIMPENQRKRHTDIFTMLVQAGKPVSSDILMEGLGLRSDGLVFPVESTFNLHWINNEPFLTLFVRNVSTRKEIEKKLHESEELFRLSFENAPIGICIFDKKGALIQANLFCETCFGRRREDIMRQGLPMFLHPDDREQTTQTLLTIVNKLERQEEFFILENRYFSADGRTIYTKQHLRGCFDTTGDLSFFIMLTEDITTAKQLSLLNESIVHKLHDINLQLDEFSSLMAADQNVLPATPLGDYELTAMETRIASMIFHGSPNKSIAEKLCISENTVKHHITSLYNKMNVRNRIGFINTIRTNRIII